MDFQRIDENTVQCRMTEEEMNSYGFAIEDFLQIRKGQESFLRVSLRWQRKKLAMR